MSSSTTTNKVSAEIVRQPATEVYAIHGADPEVLAYGMAKYSRSALSMRESLAEINEQKAEKFLNTFYFQYGHRSIADLAHVAFAIERLSILAATVVADEARWDGQERSTRYQDFQKSGYFVPEFADDLSRDIYCETLNTLFSEYRYFSDAMFDYLVHTTPKPGEMKQETYERTLHARAFDLSRYLLPLATNTSLGQIVSARTLETQVSRLLSHSHPEVRQLGGLLKEAAREQAYNVNESRSKELIEEIRRECPLLAKSADDQLLRPVKVAPTLMKYADPNQYEQETRAELAAAVRQILGDRPIDEAPMVDLLEPEPLEIELASTLLYQGSHYPYRQIRGIVEAMPASQREEIIDLGLRHRGRHDEVARAFYAGQQFRFDILMDIGGFRDMHRHRRCIQVLQDYTTKHGYEMPIEISKAHLAGRYESTMKGARNAVARLAAHASGEAEAQSQYVIPMAFRKRSLFKMDLAEAIYITELRTGEAGHFSYRNVAYAMYEAVAQRYPSLAKYFRVSDVRQPIDILKR